MQFILSETNFLFGTIALDAFIEVSICINIWSQIMIIFVRFRTNSNIYIYKNYMLFNASMYVQ